MKKSVLTFTFCVSLLCSVVAQNNIGELKKEVASSGSDSLKLEAYRKIYKFYIYTYPDSALYYLNEGHELFRKIGYTRGKAFVINMQGSVYEAVGMDDWAKKKYEESLALFKELKDDSGLGNAYNGLGMLEGKTGNFDAATKYFFDGLKLFEKAGNTNAIVTSYINLGKVSTMAEHYDIGLGFFNKAYDLLKDQPVRPNTIHLYNNIGAAYAQQGIFDSALFYFEKSLEICRKEKLTLLLISPLTNIGNIYRIIDRPKLALKYYNEALEVAQNEAPPEEKIRVELNIAKIKSESNPQESIATLERLLDESAAEGLKLLELETLSSLIEVHKKAGNYKEAMSYVERNTALEDSLFNIEKSNLIENLKIAYETDKANEKINQLEISKEANNRIKNIIILVAIVLLLLLLFITFLYRRARALNFELTQANTDKDRLFSIIGHDLKGPVSNIPMVVDLCRDNLVSEDERTYLLDSLKKNAEATIETLEKLLSWGKTHIKDTRLNPTSFDVTPDVINNIELLKGTATQKRVELINNVSKHTVIYAEEEHFRFVLRNLLSNALKFTREGGSITVDCTDSGKKEGFVVFSVKDTGVGISRERQKSIFSAFNESTRGTANEMGTGLGLMLCQKFVTENGGEIWVESEEGEGATFYFTFKKAAAKIMTAA